MTFLPKALASKHMLETRAGDGTGGAGWRLTFSKMKKKMNGSAWT